MICNNKSHQDDDSCHIKSRGKNGQDDDHHDLRGGKHVLKL